MARKKANYGSTVQLPGFPTNVRHTPQAAAQHAANQAGLGAMGGLAGGGQPQNISSQLSPLNAQPGSLQQNMAPLQGGNVDALLDKVDSGAQLEPQEAQALNGYIQQNLPQQQQGQYNPQDYLRGPLTGLFPQDNNQQQANLPYEQSPFFKAASDFQNNPNVPPALRERAKKPGFLQKVWNWIKGPVFWGGSDQRASTGSPGSVQAGQQQGMTNDPYGISEANPGLAQVLSPSGQQRSGAEGFFMGHHPEIYNVSNLTGYQQRASNYILDQALRGLQQNQPNFTPIANQQLEQFYTQTVPSLAERFTSMGGGQRSSAFQGALANAGRFLHNDLAAQNQQFNQQNRSNYTNLLNFGLTPRFNTALNPGGAGLLPGAVNAAGAVGKAYLTGGL